LTLRHFKDGQEVCIEPWRERAFPVVKDLVVDRRAFDRIIVSGGRRAGRQRDSGAEGSRRPGNRWAACIGCGACVAACPNASTALFTGAKITHLGVLPQGQPERGRRALRMVVQHNVEGFGSCTNIGEREAVCPKEIKIEVIARMNHDYFAASRKLRL
jgi:succinate dehydrogenase / fumarate reductase iron-sulfur subunit